MRTETPELKPVIEKLRQRNAELQIPDEEPLLTAQEIVEGCEEW